MLISTVFWSAIALQFLVNSVVEGLIKIGSTANVSGDFSESCKRTIYFSEHPGLVLIRGTSEKGFF